MTRLHDPMPDIVLADGRKPSPFVPADPQAYLWLLHCAWQARPRERE